MSTPDWMRGGADFDQPTRSASPLGGIIAWILALVVVANLGLALTRLIG